MPKLSFGNKENNKTKAELEGLVTTLEGLPQEDRLAEVTRFRDGTNALAVAATTAPEIIEPILETLTPDQRKEALTTKGSSGKSPIESAIKRYNDAIDPMLSSLTKEERNEVLTTPDENGKTLITMAAQSKEGAFNKVLKAHLTEEENPHNKSFGSLEELVRRFHKEDLSERGGKEEIERIAAPVLESIITNPKNIETYNDIAGNFLDGCSNQPVLGMTHLAAWTSVADAETKEEKLEAAKHVLLLDEVTTFVNSHPIDRSIEAEGGNILLSKIDDKLVQEEGNEPLRGVSKKLHNGSSGMVVSWLQDNLEEAYTEIKTNLLDKDPKEVGERITESINAETWARIAFPDQMAAIDQAFEAKQDALEDLYDYDSMAQLPAQRKEAILTTSKELTLSDEEISAAQHISEERTTEANFTSTQSPIQDFMTSQPETSQSSPTFGASADSLLDFSLPKTKEAPFITDNDFGQNTFSQTTSNFGTSTDPFGVSSDDGFGQSTFSQTTGNFGTSTDPFGVSSDNGFGQSTFSQTTGNFGTSTDPFGVSSDDGFGQNTFSQTTGNFGTSTDPFAKGTGTPGKGDSFDRANSDNFDRPQQKPSPFGAEVRKTIQDLSENGSILDASQHTTSSVGSNTSLNVQNNKPKTGPGLS